MVSDMPRGRVLLVARPWDLALVATASLTIAVAVAEAPYIGNHWLLAALISVALLISVFKRDSWGWFSLTARWMLLGFYAWAAFNKLTEGFFDATASCGLFYANGVPYSCEKCALAAMINGDCKRCGKYYAFGQAWVCEKCAEVVRSRAKKGYCKDCDLYFEKGKPLPKSYTPE